MNWRRSVLGLSLGIAFGLVVGGIALSGRDDPAAPDVREAGRDALLAGKGKGKLRKAKVKAKGQLKARDMLSDPEITTGVVAAPDRAVASGPNVLVIVWDTVRADRTSLYGYDKPTTPRMAAWAEEHAVVYDRAVSPGVWTLPSHASLFTGLPVRTHAVDASDKWLENDHITFAEAFYDAGYATYAFVANPYMTMGETNLLQGFDLIEYPWSPRWQAQAQAHLRSKLLSEDASTSVSPKWTGPGGAARNKYVCKEAGPIAAKALLQWVAQRPPSEAPRPWFAFLNYMEAHLPRVPSQAARDAVMSPEAQALALTVEQSTTTFHEFMVGERTYSPAELEAISGVYDASLIDLDATTADLLDSMEAEGLLDDTIVVLTSDHGENLGDHGLMLHKYGVHNSLSRVPLVVSWKGHLTPGRNTEPTSVADALTYAAELAEVGLPEDMRTRQAAAPQPDGGAVTEFNAVAAGSLERLAKNHPKLDLSDFARTFRALERGDHKVTVGSDDSRQLHKVVVDPNEVSDLSGGDPNTLQRMDAALKAWVDATPPAIVDGTARPERTSDADAQLKEGLEALGYLD